MASTAWSHILDLRITSTPWRSRAVIDLGHSPGIPALVEAVETVAHHARLLERGCDEVQGYLVGRPMPIDNYAALVGSPGAGRAKALKAS